MRDLALDKAITIDHPQALIKAMHDVPTISSEMISKLRSMFCDHKIAAAEEWRSQEIILNYHYERLHDDPRLNRWREARSNLAFLQPSSAASDKVLSMLKKMA